MSPAADSVWWLSYAAASAWTPAPPTAGGAAAGGAWTPRRVSIGCGSGKKNVGKWLVVEPPPLKNMRKPLGSSHFYDNKKTLETTKQCVQLLLQHRENHSGSANGGDPTTSRQAPRICLKKQMSTAAEFAIVICKKSTIYPEHMEKNIVYIYYRCI